MAIMEQPLMIAFGGLLLAGMLFGGLIQTGKKWLLYASIGALALTVGLLILERTTITPREAVKATLFVIAADLERNDLNAVIDHLSDGRPELQRQAKHYLDLIEITEVKIKNNLKIEIVDTGDSQIAEARFNVVFRAKGKASNSYRDFIDEKKPVPQFFVVRFRLEDGRWRVRDYEQHDAMAGL